VGKDGGAATLLVDNEEEGRREADVTYLDIFGFMSTKAYIYRFKM
jgi:hypothetical protein